MSEELRLIDSLVEMGLAENEGEAKDLINAGQVTVNGQQVNNVNAIISSQDLDSGIKINTHKSWKTGGAGKVIAIFIFVILAFIIMAILEMLILVEMISSVDPYKLEDMLRYEDYYDDYDDFLDEYEDIFKDEDYNYEDYDYEDLYKDDYSSLEDKMEEESLNSESEELGYIEYDSTEIVEYTEESVDQGSRDSMTRVIDMIYGEGSVEAEPSLLKDVNAVLTAGYYGNYYNSVHGGFTEEEINNITKAINYLNLYTQGDMEVYSSPSTDALIGYLPSNTRFTVYKIITDGPQLWLQIDSQESQFIHPGDLYNYQYAIDNLGNI